ncbi:MAG: hypothetical protein ABIS86_13915 [Streptosporangiaceae bacterium]
MIARRAPGGDDLSGCVQWFLRQLGPGRIRDNPADEAAEAFLDVLHEAVRAGEGWCGAFGAASRQDDHLAEFRALLFRLHVQLTGWEGETG